MRADQANRWQEGVGEVWVLRGQCEVAQGSVTARGREAVLWVTRGEAFSGQNSQIIAYFEGDVSVDYRPETGPHSPTGARTQSVRDQHWLGRFSTSTELEIQAPVTGFPPKVQPAILQRGLAARDADGAGSVRPAQFSTALPGYLPERPSVPAGPPAWSPPSSFPGLAPRTTIAPGALTGPGLEYLPPPASTLPTPPIARRIVLRSRSNVRMQGKVFPSADGQETIAVITSGVNVVVDGIQNLRGLATDKIDIETDRIVIWTSRLDALDLSGQSSGAKLQTKDTPLEFYLEGNIVFREGDRVIYAERMYYNVRGRYGIVLNAEILTPVPSYQGLVRLKADVLQQLNEANFRASGAALTSSRLGVPRYWLQAQNIEFRDLQTNHIDPFTGQVAIDPETKEAAVDHQYLATSRNNFLFLGGVPVFYWPVLATNLQKPTYFVDSVRLKSDSVFGFQALTDLDMIQLLGIQDPPEGTKWDISPDYLSKRGFALGTHGRYDRSDFFNIPGPVRGTFDAWGIQDYASGDDLGADRRDVPFDEHLRAVSCGSTGNTCPIISSSPPRSAGSATGTSWKSITRPNGTSTRTRSPESNSSNSSTSSPGPFRPTCGSTVSSHRPSGYRDSIISCWASPYSTGSPGRPIRMSATPNCTRRPCLRREPSRRTPPCLGKRTLRATAIRAVPG